MVAPTKLSKVQRFDIELGDRASEQLQIANDKDDEIMELRAEITELQIEVTEARDLSVVLTAARIV